MKKNSGAIITISMVFIGIAIVFFVMIISIFVSHINSILYNFKIEMYSLNKTAIIAVNKNKANIDNFSYDKKTYKKEFENLLKSNYELDNELKNKEKLITEIKILEYEILEERSKDPYTKENLHDRTIHTVLKLKIKPIILSSLLEDIFVFTVHEDVALNMMNK